MSTDLPPSVEAVANHRRTYAVIGGFVLGAGLLYVLLIAVSGNGLARGTSVLGVDLSGQSQEQAVETLQTELGERAMQPIEVSIDGEVVTVPPESVGLAFDAEATVAAASRTSYNPLALIVGLIKTVKVEPVITVDNVVMATYLEQVSGEVDVEAKDGDVTFTETSAEAVQPAVGRELDAPAAAAALQAAYLRSAEPVVLPIVEALPTVTSEAVAVALGSFGEPAMSGPVTLTVEGTRGGKDVTVILKPRSFGPALSMEPAADGSLAPVVSVKKLRAAVDAQLDGVLKDPKDATFRISGGRPVVVPAVTGQTVDADALSEAMLEVLPRTSGRSAVVGVTKIQPSLTTAEAKDLGVTEVLSTFTQPFPYAPYRVQNIGRAARYIDGTLLMPGEVFSMNDTVKERTEANGYTVGFVISGGRYAEELGGGVSTATTTMWHSAFYAGLKRVEQRGHSFYVSRYLPGLEATVAWGVLDLKFKNDSPNGVFIRATITNTSVTVTMYGTKRYKIGAEFGPRTNIRPFTKVYDTSEGCVVQPGVEGFRIVVTRVFKNLDGQLVKREPLTTSYNPASDITCGAKPKPKPKPSPSPSPKPSKSG